MINSDLPMPKKGSDEQINTRYKNKTFELRMTTIERLKQIKKERGITMNWFVDNAIVNEINAMDRYLKIEKLFDSLTNELPDLIRKSIDKSDLTEILEGWKKDLQPTLDLSKLQSAEFQARQSMQFEKLKLNYLYKIANQYEIPLDLISFRILESLEDDGYIYQEAPGVFVLSSQEIDRNMDLIF